MKLANDTDDSKDIFRSKSLRTRTKSREKNGYYQGGVLPKFNRGLFMEGYMKTKLSQFAADYLWIKIVLKCLKVFERLQA